MEVTSGPSENWRELNDLAEAVPGLTEVIIDQGTERGHHFEGFSHFATLNRYHLTNE